MKRLMLLLLAACSTGAASPASDPIATWLDRWSDARRCLVVEADTTQTGVTLGFLLGRSCEDELRAIPESASEALAPARRLIEAVWQHPGAPARRAAAIEQVDRFARELGRRIGREVAPPPPGRALPTLQAKQRLDLPGTLRIGGGSIQLLGERELWIDPAGTLHEYEPDRVRHLAKPVEESSPRSEQFVASAAADKQRISVWSLRGADHAYEVELSTDDGATWTLQEAPKQTAFLGAWQDPQSRAIEIAVRSEAGATSIHRLTAQQPTPVIRSATFTTDETLTACAHEGRRWTLQPLGVERFGERSIRLKHWASMGQLDCRGSTALVTSHWPDSLERCTDRCEQVFASPNSIEGRGALLEDGRWIYAVVYEQLVAVWREGSATPAFHRLGKPASLEGIAVLRGQPQLVLDDGKGREVVPL